MPNKPLIHGVLLYLFLQGTAVLFAEGLQKKYFLPVYGGFSFTNHHTNSQFGIAPYNGIAFGTGIYYQMLPKVRLGMDALYVMKGYEAGGATAPTKFNLTYLEFPVKVVWSPWQVLSLHAGPYIAGFLTSATKESEGASGSTKGNFGNDFGMEMGVWIGFQPNKNLTLGIDVRYDFGLSDIEGDNDPTDMVRTRTLMTLFNVQFGF